MADEGKLTDLIGLDPNLTGGLDPSEYVQRQYCCDHDEEIDRLRTALARAEQATADARIVVEAAKAWAATWERRPVVRVWAALYDAAQALAADVPAAPANLAVTSRQLADGPEALAQRFHEAYERLAPAFGYETREASAKPWEQVPENNRRLMTAVCAEIIGADVPAVIDAGELSCGCPAVGVFAKGCPQHGDHPGAIGAAASEPEVKP